MPVFALPQRTRSAPAGGQPRLVLYGQDASSAGDHDFLAPELEPAPTADPKPVPQSTTWPNAASWLSPLPSRAVKPVHQVQQRPPASCPQPASQCSPSCHAPAVSPHLPGLPPASPAKNHPTPFPSAQTLNTEAPQAWPAPPLFTLCSLPG